MSNSDWTTDEWIILLDLYLKGFSTEKIFNEYHIVFKTIGRLLNHNIQKNYRNQKGLEYHLYVFKCLDTDHKNKELIPNKGLQVYKSFRANRKLLDHAIDIIYSGLCPYLDVNIDFRKFDVNINSIYKEGFYYSYLHKIKHKPQVTNIVREKLVLENKLYNACPICDNKVECADIERFNKLENHYVNEDQYLKIAHRIIEPTDYELYCKDCHIEVHKKYPWINLDSKQILSLY